jgi:hypothetical protein
MTKAIRSVIVAIAIFGPAWHAATCGSTEGVMLTQGDQKLQARLTREVYHELMMLPQLTIFDHIAFKVEGNTVTLLGAVRNAILKDSAEKVAMRCAFVSRTGRVNGARYSLAWEIAASRISLQLTPPAKRLPSSDEMEKSVLSWLTVVSKSTESK